MPYMVGTTEEVEKGWYLRRYGVPYEGMRSLIRVESAKKPESGRLSA